MDTLKIYTSQNIAIEQSIASIGERIAAMLLDLLFMFAYLILFGFVFGGLHFNSLMFFGSLPLFFYGLLSELAMNGQTWGKKFLKIKVIKVDGTSISFSSYFLRWVLGLIEIFTFFGSLASITIILNRKGQRLGDIAANTAVIRLRNKNVKAKIFTEVSSDYQVIYPEVYKLSIDDIYTIQEVLEILKIYDSDLPKKTIANKARTAIEQKLGIISEQKIIPFFETILRDYNFINSRS